MNKIRFVVFGNEIIVFWLAQHDHFEDYTSELEEGQEDYIERAKSFLIELFTIKLKCIQIHKGSKLLLEKYYFIYSDGHEEYIGGTWYGLFRIINPFAKKNITTTIKKYDKEKNLFISYPERVIDSNTVEVIDVNDECYIEIIEKYGSYRYSIWKLDFEEYCGRYSYYWTELDDKTLSMFDTKEKAIEAAKARL